MRRETTQLRRALEQEHVRSRIVGGSTAMRAVRELIEQVADAPAPVMILGETGTGKGSVARTIHERSSRANALRVLVNCASLPETLLESEMFGHVKGAFTGATSDLRLAPPRRPTAELCCWMRLATWHLAYRQSCCTFSKMA